MCATAARDRGEMLKYADAFPAIVGGAAINASRKGGVTCGEVDHGNPNFE